MYVILTMEPVEIVRKLKLSLSSVNSRLREVLLFYRESMNLQNKKGRNVPPIGNVYSSKEAKSNPALKNAFSAF